jgi:hypothetical protein
MIHLIIAPVLTEAACEEIIALFREAAQSG